MSDRANKNSQRHATNVKHTRVSLDDDFEVVQSRTSSLRGPHGTSIHTARDPLKGHTTWAVGTSWEPEDDPEFSLDADSEGFEREMAASLAEVLDKEAKAEERNKKQRSDASARPKVHWKNNYRDNYLDELLLADGRGEFRGIKECPDCVSRGTKPALIPEIRCRDCFVPDLTCQSCCVRRHSRHPFHCIEKWSGSHFIKVSLKDIGLVIHLNHTSMRCPLPAPVDSRFQVLHTNGIHDVALHYCGCNREIPRHLQLLRRGLYPASQQTTRTCVTVTLLRLLHILSLTAKVSTYDFYRGLERLTPNNAFRLPKSRYRPLARVLTQWRHLKLLKRAGRGHDPSGAAGTADGELAIACPSCPHPGVNLDPDWTKAPRELQFLYALLVCMDANFRLKNNLISNYSNDPGLGIGMAYMVPLPQYSDFVLSQADEEDISTCVGFQALAKATTRNSKGLRYTGVGAVVCGRSEMILPNAVGNLQKGERYANMDFIFASAVQATQLLIVCVSYDIACQWFVNIFQRMFHWPANLQLRPGLHLRPFIPKFHYWAHKEDGHEQYSFNYGDGAGQSDGEANERVWSSHNALAGSTKVSGPGTRHDILDDNFGFWNYLKYISMGKTLIKKYGSAVAERNKQAEAHRGFTQSLPQELVAEWEVMCAKWSADGYPKTAPNPFKTQEAEMSEAEEKEEMEKVEMNSRPAGTMPLHKKSAASFLLTGLELEETQRRIRALANETADIPRNLRSSNLRDQRTLLKDNIQEWEEIRSVYMPGLVQYLADEGASVRGTWDSDPDPENVNLWLPSSISHNQRRGVCTEGLPEAELRLRTAQCRTSLYGLRQVLRLKTRMIYFKNKNISRQRDGTRSRSMIDRIHKHAIRHILKYRAGRLAKYSLEGPGDWELVYRELKNEDVRGYSSKARREDPDRRGIWEDGHEPAHKTAATLFSESDSENPQSDLEDALRSEADAARLTAAQKLKKRKKGTGETHKELSWIWTTTPSKLKPEEADHILRAEWAKSRARMHRSREEVQLLVEEMRRVLAYLAYSARIWGERITQRTATVNASLMEGLHAYANKQIEHQQSLAESFRSLWKTPLDSIVAIPSATSGDEVNRGFIDVSDGDELDGDDDENIASHAL